MPIQLGNFTPLQHKHYQLAETQSEKDAQNARDLAKIGAQGANQLASESMQQQGHLIAQQRQLQAAQGQQAAENAITERKLGMAEDQAASEQANADRKYSLEQQKLGVDMAQLGAVQRNADREYALRSQENNRDQAKFDMELHDFRAMAPLKAKTLAYAQVADILDNVDVDQKTGVADVTPYKKQIANIYGISSDDIDTMSVWGDKEKGSMEFFVFDKNKNASRPLLNKEGAPIPFSFENVKAAQEFLRNGGKAPQQNRQRYLKVEQFDENGEKINPKVLDTYSGNYVEPETKDKPVPKEDKETIDTMRGSVDRQPKLGQPSPGAVQLPPPQQTLGGALPKQDVERQQLIDTIRRMTNGEREINAEGATNDQLKQWIAENSQPRGARMPVNQPQNSEGKWVMNYLGNKADQWRRLGAEVSR